MKIDKAGRILLTGVGGDIGQSVTGCLLETEYAERLCGCDLDRYAAGRALLDVFKTAPSVSDRQRYEKFILRSIAELNLSHIIPLTEGEIDYFSLEKRRFEKLGVKVLVLNRKIIDKFLDKYLTIEYLKAHGFKAPRTYLPEDYRGNLSFPLLLKDRHSCGGKGLVRVEDQAAMDFYLRRNPRSIIQELVGTEDEEYTVAVFSDGKKVLSMAFKRQLGYGSMTKFARLAEDPRITRLVTRLARLCRLVGPMNVQMRKTKAGFFPFEINPRISSTVFFRHRFGFHDVKWWLDINHGKTVEYSPQFSSGVAVRTIGSVFFELKSRPECK
ncbi:MAG: ATP-grasp domain-containing protein [Candidatus Margulisiibacteriota bacterium]